MHQALVDKPELDRRTAADIGMAVDQVSFVTTTFIENLMDAMAEHGVVRIYGFGRFKLTWQGGSPPPTKRFGKQQSKEGQLRTMRVYFTKARGFTKAIKERQVPHGQTRRR